MRFISRRLLALGFGLALAGLTPAAESFDVVVRQLAHPKYAEREKAARQLIEAGEPALPSLRAVLNSPDEETRQRAEAIIAKIELAARSQKLLVAPKLRIKFDNKPLSQTLAEVNKLAKLNLAFADKPGTDMNKKITLDTGELPYWEAVEAYLKATGLGEEFAMTPAPVTDARMNIRQRRVIFNGPGGVIVNEADVSYPQAAPRLALVSKPMPSHAGNAIRIKAVPADHPGSKPDPVTGDVKIHLQADAQPGLAINEIVGIDIRKAKAVDGRTLEITRGTPQPLPGQPEELLIGGGRIMVQQQALIEDGTASSLPLNSPRLVPVTLKSGGLKIRELEELSGVLTARVVAPKDTLFTIDRVKEVSARQFTAGEGLRINFKEATTRLTSTAVVRLTMEMDSTTQNFLNFQVPFKGRNRPFLRIQRNGGPAAPEAGNVPEFYLMMPNGEARKAFSVAATNMQASEESNLYELEILFEKPEKWEGVGLVAKGRRIVTVEMPFTLKGVPMPDK